MYTANIIDQEKTYLEAHQRFLDQKRGAYNAGYDSGYDTGYDSGHKEGEVRFLISTICENIKQGRKLDEFAPFLNSDLDMVSRIYNIAVKYSPSFDSDKIFEELKSLQKS